MVRVHLRPPCITMKECLKPSSQELSELFVNGWTLFDPEKDDYRKIVVDSGFVVRDPETATANPFKVIPSKNHYEFDELRNKEIDENLIFYKVFNKDDRYQRSLMFLGCKKFSSEWETARKLEDGTVVYLPTWRWLQYYTPSSILSAGGGSFEEIMSWTTRNGIA